METMSVCDRKGGGRAIELAALIGLGLFALATPAAACVFDAECPLGSRCSRDPVTYTGQCIDRLEGGSPQRNQTFDPLAPGTQGVRRRTCSFDVDCRALGARCLKRKGFLSGVCIGN